MGVRRPSLFGTSATSGLFASLSSSTATSSPGEVDLRAEFDLLVFGDATHPRHGHLIVLRHLRRDSVGDPVECSCISRIGREGDPDCSYCDGERYLWDEQWYWCYSTYSGTEGGLSRRQIYMPSGAVRADYRIFFLRYDTNIRYGDKVVEMKLDSEGAVIVPYIRESIYKPQTIQKFRSDNGRIEYIKVFCREESAIRSDTPE